MDSFIHNVIPFFQSEIGKIFFIPIYALWVTILLPGVWASMLAGALYGTWMGSLIVFLGACLGAEVSFLLGRTVLREWVRKIIENKPKMIAIEKAINQEGLKLIILTRLSPVFPFSILNFLYGLTKVTFKDYTIGLVGILPGTILFCNLGALAGTITEFNKVLTNNQGMEALLIRLAGLLSTLIVILIVSKSTKKALQESDPSK